MNHMELFHILRSKTIVFILIILLDVELENFVKLIGDYCNVIIAPHVNKHRISKCWNAEIEEIGNMTKIIHFVFNAVHQLQLPSL